MQSSTYTLFATFGICCAIQAHLIAQPVYSPSDYRFQHYDMSDGLASESAKEIVQDSLGFLWILHDNGLSRYDGYTFKVYRHDPNDEQGPGFPLDGFLELDKSGNLWLLSHQGLQPGWKAILTKYDRKKDGFIKYYPDLKGVGVHGVSFDKNGTTLWLAGLGHGLYSFDTKTGETKNYLNKHPDSVVNLTRGTFMEQRNAIFGISDRDSILLLATWRGLWQFNKATKKFSYPKCHPADSSMFHNAPFLAVLEWPAYSKDLCFVVYDIGLVKTDQNLSQKVSILHAGLNNVRDRSFLRDKYGVFWLTDIDNGLFRYDPTDSSLINLKHDPNDPYSLRSKRLTGFTIDRDQNLWVATQDRGISKLPKQHMRFYNYNFRAEITGNTLYKTEGKNHLIVSQSKTSQPQDGEILVSPINPSNLGSLDFKTIELKKIKGIRFAHELTIGKVSLLAMGKNHLWIGMRGGNWGQRVVGLPISPLTGIIETGSVQILELAPENPNTRVGNFTSGIWEDSEQILWLGSGNGLSKVDFSIPYGKEGSVIRYRNIPGDSTSLSNNFIWWKFYPEDKNSFWVITASGLDLFHKGSFEHYFKNDYVMTVKRDSKGALLVGTISGLYESTDKENFKFKKHPSKILSESGVNAFQEDKLGRLWISTNGRIRCYDREGNNVVTFGKEEGFDFARDWVEQTSDGVFITSDAQGVSLFDPMSFKIDKAKITPVYTRLTVNNEIPTNQNTASTRGNFSVKNDISVLDELVLDYQHNNFTLEFSAMELTAPEKNLYKHKLEGYDKDWIETDYKNRSATYTNLPAGDYTFKVKASNRHGIWSDQEKTLPVKILPPPWRTWWAYTGYLMLISGMLIVARRMVVQRERLKSNLKLEHLELEKVQEIGKAKTNFFANISHEFRTPLTLIKGPVQNLLEQFRKDKEAKSQLNLIQQNSDRLLKLVNQMLELARLESGSLKKEIAEGDLVSFLKIVVVSFSSFAFQKHISLLHQIPDQVIRTRFDHDKLEKIISNLIVNAIKFTPENGSVTIHAILQGGATEIQHLTLHVTDTGKGVPPDQLDKIFERFYQVSEDGNQHAGTGIGLALSKELTEFLGGTLTVESKVGEGTRFTLTLPVEVLEISEAVQVEHSIIEEVVLDGFDVMSNGVHNQSLEKPLLLIVEDHVDLRKFIISCLGNDYRFIEAGDGKEGLQKAIEEVPALVLSDVMMPQMDGIEMCHKLKHDLRTSHIPLILLTAKATDESKLSGLETGADDYLIKPFNKIELLLKIRNQITAHAKMQEKIRLEFLSRSTPIEAVSNEEKFLAEVRKIIEARLTDEQLGVETIAKDIGLSRTQLYRKITALTGISMSEFVRKLRLQKASELLQQHWGPVSQVAYEVGFNNLSYFSKCFKEQFGVLPSEYGAKGE